MPVAGGQGIMGFPVLEALPSRRIPYNRVDPFLLVHEGRMRLSEVAKVDTRHPKPWARTSATRA